MAVIKGLMGALVWVSWGHSYDGKRFVFKDPLVMEKEVISK